MPTGKHPSYFKELIDTHGISMPCDQLWTETLWIWSQRKRCYNGFQLCTLSMSECFFPFMCVYALCTCRCLQRPEGHKILQNRIMDTCKPRGRCFCKGSKCSFTTIMSLPLLGHVKLHIWLVLFFCNRIALEAADPTMQVSSFHIICILQYSR